ncbi:PRC-barrel domain-containing protein [Rubrivirga litoralis]|uniref:PRC-barrel domain-containing protein n=1 Tax=Rubrivirga litoralis TaxID=3075598 RepID=A0ABU3BSH6_9BACT|nr:PRC-barrel domain-containing protein [Rubrivirga sp. F394]MDT0632251.1 PRC-barrel domain-containing protein [Rubrivirga sp. F394]
MSRIALSDSGDWQLEFPDDQDVRGYPALDADGNRVGTVDTMIVNTDEERVDAILLDDGTEYPARDLSIGDDVVYLTTVNAADDDVDGTVTVFGDSGQVLRRERVEDADFDAHADSFRTHYGSTYGTSGGAYEDYEPAYRYGYESAYDDSYKNRPYLDAEDDLRTGYGTDYADRDFDADRDAVRYGYTRAQHANR